MQIEPIAIAKLVSSETNVRRVDREHGIEALAQSIAAHGLMSNLTVRKMKGGRYEVIAGHRRFLALTRLVEAGTLAKDATVPCMVRAASDNATEISLAENTLRADMHIVDAVTAYASLIEQGMSVEAIAQRFGQAATTVQRSLKLAALSPRLLDELRTNAMTVAQAKALAVSDDHAAQESAWFEAHDWQRQPHQIRNKLTRDYETGGSYLARYVGIEAYEAAGGHVARDLFADDDAALLLDRALLTRLAEAKLVQDGEAIRAHGWKWVESRIETPDIYRMGRLTKVETLSDERTAELKRLYEAYERRESEVLEQGGEDAVADDRPLGELGNRIEAIESDRFGYDPAEMAHAGCVVTLDYRGELQVHAGLVLKEDEPALKALQGERIGDPSSEAIPAATPGTVAGGYSAALIEDLTAERTAALRVELADNPSVALVAIVHPLLMQLFYRSDYGALRIDSAVEVRGEHQALSRGDDAVSQTKAWRDWSLQLEQWHNGVVPADPGEVWPWLIEQDEATLLKALAVGVAANLNGVSSKYNASPTRLENTDQIAHALGLDMATFFVPDERFLKRLNKAQIVEAMTEANARPDAIAAATKGKKAEAVKIAAGELLGSGWVPEPIRRVRDEDGDALPAAVTDAMADTD
ncbi:ParB/RepB/Spo0J family partition protein [Marinivivus vitaminiproducens]|uniref:ParB/RepB/Spo0J family partition protein n=1 Tax=Marinivivus vitaminiproducens TaxID=3035935 RepID=UPI0027A4A823|nr:ParB/RepB/Spo0J family partition protein [Geminicoccaceae bacterium SCSIO 64248]